MGAHVPIEAGDCPRANSKLARRDVAGSSLYFADWPPASFTVITRKESSIPLSSMDVTPRRFRQLLEAASVLRFHKLQRLTRARLKMVGPAVP